MGPSPPTPPPRPSRREVEESRPGLGERMRSFTGSLSTQGLADWWRRWNRPVVLRLPRAYALLLAAGVLLVVVLAYWVGNVRGYNRLIAEENANAGPGLINLAGVDQGGLAVAAADAGSPAAAVPARRDPREPGLNYLIVARYPLEEAQRLIAFLKTQGVEAIGVPSQNRVLYHVVALPGFDGSEISEGAGARFREEMLRVGQRWKAHNNNKGDDLATMYFRKHQP